MKSISLLIAAMLLFSGYVTAQFWGEKGNGQVQRQHREISKFHAISAANGLNVYIKQGDKVSVVVETDENLQDYVITEVKNRELRLRIDGKIRNATKLNVYVTFIKINKIHASSGANVQSKNTFNATDLNISVSSGANTDLDLTAKNIDCSVSSGANAKLAGTTIKFDASASSGSHLKAIELQADHCNVEASSGANIKLFANKSLHANASSGGDIKYSGNPSKTNIKISSGGKINQK